MIKKISVFLLAIALLLSVPACSMPDAIFSDEVASGDGNSDASSTADIYGFEFSLGDFQIQLPISYSALSSRGWTISEASEMAEDEKPAANATGCPRFKL